MASTLDGHGLADAPMRRRTVRVAAVRAYVEALRRGEEPVDARFEHHAHATARRGSIPQMTTPIGTDAQHLNPALEPLAPLVGEWWTTGMHPLVPAVTFHGRTSFAWHEGGPSC